MGVTGLWTVVQPCARPIKIETLNRKRLAVDASLWIYAFLKAVRDKEGNALRNSHVVGFYRRICKLLYIGIQPVFVFDGGAPALKRQTINGRKQRREGRREDAVRTAGKLLALQMQRRAEEEDQKQRDAAARPVDREEEEVPDDAVYVEEQLMSPQERQKQKFKKTDQYHLPELDVSLAEMGQPNDPRVMSLEELEHYARQFDSGEDINVYDFSKIDFNSPFFQSLPPSDRYNILNAARLRSRLRMGLSKDQLDTMFPDRMAFSRFQIERVKERNELTQRLMNVNGMGDDPVFGIGRVAGEKGREYVLVKNAGVEGGWALGVIGDRDEGGRDKPIDVDQIGKPALNQEQIDSEEDEDAFEDVPIEGLNRLPKLSRNRQDSGEDSINANAATDITRRRNALYKLRKTEASTKSAAAPIEEEDPDSLFIGGTENEPKRTINKVQDSENDDEAELQRAIAMSLENGGRVSSPEENDYEEVFQQNEKALDLRAKGTTTALPITAFQDSDDESEMEFENVLEAHHTSNRAHQPPLTVERRPTWNGSTEVPKHEESTIARPPKFDGPLPFEKLDLGSSILGKKKMKKLEEDNAGGFEKNMQPSGKSKASAALPPWFSGDLKTGIEAQNNIEKEDRERSRAADEGHFVFPEQAKLQKSDEPEVIDVDALEEKKNNVIDVESSEDEGDGFGVKENIIEDTEILNGDATELSPDDASVPQPVFNESTKGFLRSQEQPLREESEDETYEWEESDREVSKTTAADDTMNSASAKSRPGVSKSPTKSPSITFEDVDMTEARHKVTGEASFTPEMDDEETGQSSRTAHESVPLLDESDDERYGSEAEDEELLLQMATEAEEHARFASTLNSRSQRQNIEDFERELKLLQSQQKKDRRDADEVTHVMITECQQLLKLFGLPYITAPMEAEAQCAELVSLGLVDGIVTDDSDIFLFGGTRIYKNMFNQSKYVECYLASDLEREFDLTREKMIRIAHLLGSDYTEGLPGVGPVTALEIVSEFPGGLEEFKDWWTRVQTGAKPTDDDTASAFRRKFRRNSTRLFLPPAFPDKRVDQAYLQPDVDSDPSSFQWGVPDLDALRSYLMATVGWTQERTDEVLVPVIRDMNRRETEGTQANITRYISGGAGTGAAALAPRRNGMGKSKRMESALEKLAERARARRKAAAADTTRNAGSGDGTTVGDGAASRGDAKSKFKAGSKRKVASSAHAEGRSDDDDDSEPQKSKQKKLKKKKSSKKK